MKIEKDEWIPVICGVLALMLLGFSLGDTVGGCSKECEAVKADVAEWIADENGKAQFKWITDAD